MTAEARDAAVAEIIAAAAKSTVDWDAASPTAIATIVKNAAGRLDVTTRQREVLIGIAASAINAVLAFDRRQSPRRGDTPPPTREADTVPPKPTPPPMQSFDRGAWGRPIGQRPGRDDDEGRRPLPYMED